MSDNIFYSFNKKRIYDQDKQNLINVFDADLLRVMSSPAFRRLQDKTQLFPLEANDYARTRLTHSCEVAATGRSLASAIIRNYKGNDENIKNKLQDILYSLPICCFLHDIGNPPFGHFGEEIIRQFFANNWSHLNIMNGSRPVSIEELFDKESQEYKDFINFDGNAQGLRLVSHVESDFNQREGLNLTCCVLGGLIKYPYPSTILKGQNNKHKFGYFKSEEDIVNILKDNGDFKLYHVHPLALLMEAADDISMFFSDVQDSAEKGLFTMEDIDKFYSGLDETSDVLDNFIKKLKNKYKTNIAENKKGNILSMSLSAALSKFRDDVIDDIAKNIVLHKLNILNYDCDDYQRCSDKNKDFKGLLNGSVYYSIVDFWHKIINAKIYGHKNIIMPELKGEAVLSTLLSKFTDSILSLSYNEIKDGNVKTKNGKIINLISKKYLNNYLEYAKKLDNKSPEYIKRDCYARLHLIVDEICGMTDNYALSLYNELTK